MFDSTMELFTMDTSNPLLIFGLCNLIIVVLLLSSSKPSSPGTQESFISAREVPKRIEKEKQKGGHESFTSNDIEASFSANVPQATNVEISPAQEVVSYVGTEESDNEDECEEDELRKRIGEFIEKVNRRWKAEKLMTLNISRSPLM